MGWTYIIYTIERFVMKLNSILIIKSVTSLHNLIKYNFYNNNISWRKFKFINDKLNENTLKCIYFLKCGINNIFKNMGILL